MHTIAENTLSAVIFHRQYCNWILLYVSVHDQWILCSPYAIISIFQCFWMMHINLIIFEISYDTYFVCCSLIAINKQTVIYWVIWKILQYTSVAIMLKKLIEPGNYAHVYYRISKSFFYRYIVKTNFYSENEAHKSHHIWNIKHDEDIKYVCGFKLYQKTTEFSWWPNKFPPPLPTKIFVPWFNPITNIQS